MKRHYFRNILFILIIGFCLGMLTGLSISPVIQTVILTVLTFIISILTTWFGIRSDNNDNFKILKLKIDIIPIGLLVIGLTGGCFVGIYFRANDILGPKKRNDEKNMQHKTDSLVKTVQTSTVLFSIDQNVCEIISGYSGEILISRLRTIDNPTINNLIDSMGEKNIGKIKQVLEKICKNE